MSEALPITIEYYDMSQEQCSAMTLLEVDDPVRAHEIKARLVTKLGIEIQPGELAQHAWLRHLSAINHVEFTTPCHPGIANAICDEAGAQRFMWVVTELPPKEGVP